MKWQDMLKEGKKEAAISGGVANIQSSEGSEGSGSCGALASQANPSAVDDRQSEAGPQGGSETKGTSMNQSKEFNLNLSLLDLNLEPPEEPPLCL